MLDAFGQTKETEQKKNALNKLTKHVEKALQN